MKFKKDCGVVGCPLRGSLEHAHATRAFEESEADGTAIVVLSPSAMGYVPCTCAEIMRADKTRHFRGCPMRELYPAHEAEKPAAVGDLRTLLQGVPPDGFKKLDAPYFIGPGIDLNGVHLRALDLAKNFVSGWSTPHGWRQLNDAQMINAFKSHMVQFYIAENNRSLSEAETEEHKAVYEAATWRRSKDRPKIVTLCGSTRFSKAFADANLAETLAGKIVLTVGSMTHSDDELSHCTVCGKVGKREALMGDTCLGRKLKDGEGAVRSVDPHRIERSLTPEVKEMLDALHFRKIEMADEILVLNARACRFCKLEERGELHGTCACAADHKHAVEPYIGDSTRNEIAHAFKLGKRIRFLNPQNGVSDMEFGPGHDPTPEGVHLGLVQLGLAQRTDVRRNAIPIDCDTCVNKCMDMDMDPYCIAVNKPYGQVLTRPRHKDCAGEKGDEYKLWERDTRGPRGGG